MLALMLLNIIILLLLFLQMLKFLLIRSNSQMMVLTSITSFRPLNLSTRKKISLLLNHPRALMKQHSYRFISFDDNNYVFYFLSLWSFPLWSPRWQYAPLVRFTDFPFKKLLVFIFLNSFVYQSGNFNALEHSVGKLDRVIWKIMTDDVEFSLD